MSEHNAEPEISAIELATLTEKHIDVSRMSFDTAVPQVAVTSHGPIVKQGPVPAIANLGAQLPPPKCPFFLSPPPNAKKSLSVNCILAAGAVGGPYALAQAGLPLGLFAYCGVAMLMDYSLILLVETAITNKILDYQAMCKKGAFEPFKKSPPSSHSLLCSPLLRSQNKTTKTALGWMGYVILSLVQFGQGYGCMVTYLMVAADTVESLLMVLLSIIGPEKVPAIAVKLMLDRRIIVLVLVFCIILPICFLRNITSLAKTSYMSIISVWFIAAAVMLRWLVGVARDSSEEPAAPCYKFSHISFAEGLGIAAFSFVTHHEALLLYKGLEDNKPQTWENITHYSMTTSLLCLLMIAVPGYLTFYDDTKDNILLNYSIRDPVMTVSRLMFGLTMILTFPLEHFVARSVALDLVNLVIKRGSQTLKWVITTFVLVLSSAAIATMTRDLGAVLTLTGGVCASTLAYIMPGLLYLMFQRKQSAPKTKTIAIFLISLGGFLVIGCPGWVIYRLIAEQAVVE